MPSFQFLGPEGESRLDAALALVESGYYETEADTVAACFNALINNHPFRDGNKRFAIVAIQVMLINNQRIAILTDSAWERLAIDTASGILRMGQIAHQFSACLMPGPGTTEFARTTATLAEYAEFMRMLPGPED